MATVVEPPPIQSRPPPRGWSPDRRFLGLAIVVDVVAMTLAYIAVTVPIAAPQLTDSEAHRYWLVAVCSALIVALVGRRCPWRGRSARRGGLAVLAPWIAPVTLEAR